MLLIPTRVLMLVAAVVWIAAGSLVVATGLGAGAALGAWNLNMALGAAVVYALFLAMFILISRRHIKRIKTYTEPLMGIYKFFDVQSYVVLVLMMGFGLIVRMSGIVPGDIIAFFYSGLGMALVTSGLFYIVYYLATAESFKISARPPA